MKEIELFEDKRAFDYNNFVKKWIPNYQYFINILPKLLHSTSNKNLLVVGCGTGNEIESFRQYSEEWEITGVDPSPEMIHQAITKFENYEKITLVEGVVNDLDISNKFGAATLLLVLHFMADDGAKYNLLKSIVERLEKNAPLVLLDITGDLAQIKSNLRVLKQLLPNDVSKDDVENRLYRIEHKLHAVAEDRLMCLLQEVGFDTPLRFYQNSIYMGWITKKK